MAEFESVSGRPVLYFLVKQGDRVVIQGIPKDELGEYKNSGTEWIGEGYETREMAEAALEDYLGDTRAV